MLLATVRVPVAVSALKVAVPEKAGLFEKTRRFEPVSSVRELLSDADSAVVVALLCASVKRARDAVWLVSLRIPVMVVLESVGAVPKTRAPVPVSSVTSDESFAEVFNDEDAIRPLNEVQSAPVRHPCVPAVAVLQLSVLVLHDKPVPLVIRVDGVV